MCAHSAQRTRARQLCARFNATLIMISSTQYAFKSCSFNYKSDYINCYSSKSTLASSDSFCLTTSQLPVIIWSWFLPEN